MSMQIYMRYDVRGEAAAREMYDYLMENINHSDSDEPWEDSGEVWAFVIYGYGDLPESTLVEYIKTHPKENIQLIWENGGYIGSIYAPGDGTAYANETQIPDFDEDDEEEDWRDEFEFSIRRDMNQHKALI